MKEEKRNAWLRYSESRHRGFKLYTRENGFYKWLMIVVDYNPNAFFFLHFGSTSRLSLSLSFFLTRTHIHTHTHSLFLSFSLCDSHFALYRTIVPAL